MDAPRTLLVHVDADPRSLVRLRVALDLAERFGARLSALFAAAPPPMDVALGHAALSAAEQLQARHAERATQVRAGFDALAAGRMNVHWVELNEPRLLDAVAEQATLADLLVLGQDGPWNGMRGLPIGFADALLRTSGRPALLLPPEPRMAGVGRVALVAWRPTAEAARALRAALPLLAGAEQVHLVSWGASTLLPAHGTPFDPLDYLALHGITAQAHLRGREPVRIGEALLGLARELNADLLVMGCYGHSRAREFVLGGASRSVLRDMDRAVLMSH